ncbi:TetR/AcrR family transcriptional regulator C-terminal domain-containing protein [Nonomuraea lactucae]|uniref:TetR/AcrR family transcriptional regulator C-terminal domain-containing protein n=1 Tax=Nonomuraea lactucae TaxID=2249762 RepID=UPI0013B40520|nr:TetR/AcrR family transcriptional regulator C-terminal domain-containing protein [Nonomuraea lactucae]
MRSGSFPSALKPVRARIDAHLRELLLAHPGAALLIAGGPPTPGSVKATANALQLLAAAGMSPRLAGRAQRAVISYVVGWVLMEHGIGARQRASYFAQALLLAQRHPGSDPATLARAAIPDRSEPGEFEFGLDAFLDGLSLRLEEEVHVSGQDPIRWPVDNRPSP